MSYPAPTSLSPEEQAKYGLATPAPMALADRVRFSELDRLNHVNNTAYLVWFETARVAYMMHCGLSSYTDDTTEPRLVIRRGVTDWLKEMVADQPYMVTARAIAYRNTSFTVAQEVWSNGVCHATFECVVVILTPDGSARMPIPDAVLEYFHTVDGVPKRETL